MTITIYQGKIDHNWRKQNEWKLKSKNRNIKAKELHTEKKRIKESQPGHFATRP